MKAILYDWGGMNVALFHAINNLRGSFIDRVMALGTTLGAHAHFPYYIVLIALFALAQERRAAQGTRPAPVTHPVKGAGSAPSAALVWLNVIAVFSLAFVVDAVLVGWIKTTLNFPRPLLALPPGTVHVIGVHVFHSSLPSGHATFAATLAASLWPAVHTRMRVGLVLFVLWVGISRVNVGAHFPADVLAGSLLGLVVVLILQRSVRYVINRVPEKNL